MDMKKICKDTGNFFVGSSVWMAEKTAQGAVIAAKGTVIAAKAAAKAAKKMTRKGEQIAAEQRARREERKAAEGTRMENEDGSEI